MRFVARILQKKKKDGLGIIAKIEYINYHDLRIVNQAPRSVSFIRKWVFKVEETGSTMDKSVGMTKVINN